MVSDNSYGFCGECESSGHILWDCVITAEVWTEVGINLPTVKQPMKNFIDVVWTLKERDGVAEWELFAIAAWMIWNNRNNFKHKGRCKEPKRIALDAREYMQEGEIDHRPLCGSRSQVRSKWCPPRQGSFKVNVDGAVFSSLKSCGIRVVIRNEARQIMGAMSRFLPLPLGAMEVEAKAMEEGIKLAWDLGLWEVEMESDAQVLVKAINAAALRPISILKVVEGIKVGLGSFKQWLVCHTSRQNNIATHLMAREVRSFPECRIWVEDTPPVIAV